MNSNYKETYMIIESNLKFSFKVEVALRRILEYSVCISFEISCMIKQ